MILEVTTVDLDIPEVARMVSKDLQLNSMITRLVDDDRDLLAESSVDLGPCKRKPTRQSDYISWKLNKFHPNPKLLREIVLPPHHQSTSSNSSTKTFQPILVCNTHPCRCKLSDLL